MISGEHMSVSCPNTNCSYSKTYGWIKMGKSDEKCPHCNTDNLIPVTIKERNVS